MAWTAQITGLDTLVPEMQAAAQEGTKAGLEGLGVKGAEFVQENIRTPFGDVPPAVAFGTLVSSIVSTYVSDPGGQGIVIGVSDQAGASAYAAPVETGAVPHMPPASALVPWVQKKFNIQDEKTALSMAFAISKSIAKKGMRGHEMFSRALAALQPLAVPTLEKNLAQAFMRHGFTALGGA